MTFRKYICKSCFTLFIKNKTLVVVECPKCKSTGPICERGEFERKQPWPREEKRTEILMVVTTDKIDNVPFRVCKGAV